MKVAKLNTPNNFNPVDIVITIETREELDMLRSVYLVKAETTAIGANIANTQELKEKTNNLITKMIDAITYEIN